MWLGDLAQNRAAGIGMFIAMRTCASVFTAQNSTFCQDIRAGNR
jgi:hypothetical protein